MSDKPVYFDLEKHTFRDETSQFDPAPKDFDGNCYTREYVCYVPARLMRRRPDLFDEFFERHHEDEWFWGVAPEPEQELICLK